MIQIRGLCKTFATRRVLFDLDAQVPAGAIVALVGPSGSGKSTLLRCINGLETFDSGTVDVAGYRLMPGPNRPLQGRIGARVGMVFQDYQLFPHLTALENVSLAPRVVQKLSAGEALRVARNWLDRVGLDDHLAALPSELSGGQRQRVALARALAQGARVLLLDEPTSALDPERRAGVQSMIVNLVRAAGAQPLTVVVATHDLEFAQNLADEIWGLEAGKLAPRTNSALSAASAHA